MSRAAFHRALHVFGSHSHWERTGEGLDGEGELSGKKKTFYKQMTRRHWILMFKNGSRKINTYQKEQHRNKKEIEQKQEIEK